MGFCLNLLRDWVNRDIELVAQLHGALVSSLKWRNYSICPTELFWGLNEHVCKTVSVQLVVVQLLSHFRLFATPWTAPCQASLSFTISQNLLKLVSIESVMPSIHLILTSSPSHFSQSFPASGSFPVSWLFTSGGQGIESSASGSVLPMNIQCGFPLGLTGLISLLSKRLLQHHSLRASILHHSAFLMVQLSHWYMTTGKSIALTIQTFVTKWYLFFNMLSRFVITFLLKSKFMAIVTTVILEPPFPPNKVCHCFHFFHYVLAIISLRTEGGVLDLVTW